MKKIPIIESIKFLEYGFKNYSKLSDSKHSYNVNRIFFSQQNALVVEYITNKTDPMDIKIELGEIISFIGSFYLSNKDDTQYELPNLFAATALDNNKNKLIYVISSHSAATSIMRGNPIEWLKNSIFEDQSKENLMIQAKRTISRIEISLRKTIYKILSDNNKKQWCDQIDENIFNHAYKNYKKNNTSCDKNDSKILSYTYLPELKSIIEDNWEYFKTIFIGKKSFDNNMNQLNKIRRDESHNRPITQEKLKILNGIYQEMMTAIAKIIPEVVPQYIVDNWHINLIKITEKLSKAIPKLEEEDRTNFRKTLNALKEFYYAVKIAVIEIKEILIPNSKIELHRKLEKILSEMEGILSNMIKYGAEIQVPQLENEFIKYSKKLNELNDFQKEYLYSEI